MLHNVSVSPQSRKGGKSHITLLWEVAPQCLNLIAFFFFFGGVFFLRCIFVACKSDLLQML